MARDRRSVLREAFRNIKRKKRRRRASINRKREGRSSQTAFAVLILGFFSTLSSGGATVCTLRLFVVASATVGSTIIMGNHCHVFRSSYPGFDTLIHVVPLSVRPIHAPSPTTRTTNSSMTVTPTTTDWNPSIGVTDHRGRRGHIDKHECGQVPSVWLVMTQRVATC